MFYTAGFYKSLTGPLTYATVSAAVDQGLTQGQNGGYILPTKMRVKAAHAAGTVVTAAQINAPSLRNYALPEIYPVTVAATIADSVALQEYGASGPIVQANEEMTIGVSNSGSAATDNWAAIWLVDKQTPAPGGPVITLPATATITSVKGAWALGALTFGTVLPAGQYAVVGLEVTGTGLYLARLVFPGFSQYRPGVIVQSAYGRTDRYGRFRMGNSGLFGSFFNTAQPQLEVFGLAAGASAPTVYLDLVKTG